MCKTWEKWGKKWKSAETHWRSRCSDTWQWTWMVFWDLNRREGERNRRREWLLCVNCWSLSIFILNVSVVAVKLLRVPVVMRNCCEIHPLAPNPLLKLYTSFFNRFGVSKSELAILWQAVLWRETSSLGWWVLPSVVRWLLTLWRYLLLFIASERGPGWLNHCWTSSVQMSVWGWILTHFLKLLQLKKRVFR